MGGTVLTMGGMWCSVVVAERGGSSLPFVGGVVDHRQHWCGGPSSALVWWTIVSVGGVVVGRRGCW